MLLALALYCRLPFGRFHKGNSEVKRIAALIGRTPDALAMRLSNFASQDPIHRARGVKGLDGGGKKVAQFWAEATAEWNSTAVETELVWQRATGELPTERECELEPPGGPTEATRLSKVRLVQGFFRRTVLASYASACAVCGISPEPLLVASHIIPWSINEARRADPTNGLCLCALHDKAFDSGLLSIDEGMRILVSNRLQQSGRERNTPVSKLHIAGLIEIAGQELRLPSRFPPDASAVAWHRKMRFVA
ncbi:MAG: HNH endonuclease [Planctomycetes bacterium]|nr:HNH endonuclease [Planctomycetota bacterium]